MRKHTVDYYDWIDDVGPVLLANLNELLEVKGVEPVRDLHGGTFKTLTELHDGTFKNGKWVSSLESEDYRNYWHAYIHLWGEKLQNDSFQVVYFPNPDKDEEWEYCIKSLREWAVQVYKPADPTWTDDLVSAMRKVVKDHFPLDKHEDYCKVVFWWCW